MVLISQVILFVPRFFSVLNSHYYQALKSVVFAMGWKGERRADLEQAKTHKHQHQI